LESNENMIRNEQEISQKERQTANSNVFVSYLHDLVTLIAGVLLVFSLLFRVVIVSGPSMNSTLVDGD